MQYRYFTKSNFKISMLEIEYIGLPTLNYNLNPIDKKLLIMV